MDDLRLEFESQVLEWPRITTKYMFGSITYLAGGKLFAFLDDEYVVITQLDGDARQILESEHEAYPFESKDKPVGGWVKVAISDSAELADIVPFIQKSYEVALKKSQEE